MAASARCPRGRTWATIECVNGPDPVTRAVVTVDDRARVLADVDQVVGGRDGNLLARGAVNHGSTFRDGLVARLDIVEPTVDDGG